MLTVMVFTMTASTVIFLLPNPLLVNNLLQRNTLVDRFVGTASADVDLLGMVGIKSKNHGLHYNVNLSYSKTERQRIRPGFLPGFRATVYILPRRMSVFTKGLTQLQRCLG